VKAPRWWTWAHTVALLAIVWAIGFSLWLRADPEMRHDPPVVTAP
jgi:hypothetical protein